MDLFEEIKKQKLVSPSIIDILFGNDEDEREIIFDTECDYPKVLYNVCLFYSVLLQIYFIMSAQNESETLKESNLSEQIYLDIKKYWVNNNLESDFRVNNNIFSFLLDCTNLNNPFVMGADARRTIANLRDIYQRYERSTRMMGVIQESGFINILEALPLLRFTELDEEANKIKIQIPGCKTIYSECKPFLFFINPKTKSIVDRKSGRPYIMTNVLKGERNNELRFLAVELNSLNIIPRTTLNTIPISSSEQLLLICKVLEIPTQWYSIGEFMGDYQFLIKLTEVAKEVLIDCLQIKKHYSDSERVNTELKEFFANKEIRNRIKKDKTIIKSNIDKLLFELFIEYGVFKTFWSLLMDSNDYNKEDLFLCFMKSFLKKGIITNSQYEDDISECESAITAHENKLKTIVLEKSKAFIQRSKEIKAEWRTYHILKTAGIKNKKLFTDVENVLSIDDYFDMIGNTYSTSEDDLRSILSFLIEFYTPLVDDIGGAEFDEKLEKKVTNNWNITELFDEFIKIVEKSFQNKRIEELIGRESICDTRVLEDFKKKFAKDIIEDKPATVLEKSFFISYSHEDRKVVEQIVDTLKSLHYNIYFDKDKFNKGEDWKSSAMKAILDRDCIGVIAFASKSAAVSEAVAWELKFARKAAKNKYPNNPDEQDRFIMPVNLLESDIFTYLDDISLSKNREARDNAAEIKKIIHKNKIYFRYRDPSFKEDLKKELDDLRQRHEAEGYIVKTDSYSGISLDMANFYTFLKTGEDRFFDSNEIAEAFEDGDLSRCIYPIVISVKETRIKRDNITLSGYEIIIGKGREGRSQNYILSSKNLNTEDYYCIPNYRRVGENYSWMIEPLLISHEDLNHNSRGMIG